MKSRIVRIEAVRLPACVVATCLVLTAAMLIAAGVHADVPRSSSITGRVKIEGARPKSLHISMAADPACAKAHPSGVNNDDVVAGSEGGLENVVVFVSQGLPAGGFNAPAEPAHIEQKGCMYEPHVVAVQENQKLRVVNEDATLHNIHPLPSNNREWNKAEPPGSTIEETFPREEVAIPVKCNVHPWMRSYIAVFRHPFFAVSGKNGAFELKNLPPGNYTIEAWHEKLGKSQQTITVGAGETKSLDFVFKGSTSN